MGELTLKTLENIIEALLLVSGNQVSCKDIADKTGVTEKEVLSAAKNLQESKYSGESGIQLLVFNKKLQFCSNPEYSEDVSAVLNPIKERELSKSMLEVAAIIAYKQPVTRIDLEELRGTNSEFALQNLLKMNVIEVVGRKDTVGKPVLFGTTDEFLKRFQISSLDELPDYDELINRIAKLRSPSSDSSYLFEKDEYVEENDENLTQSVIEGVSNDTENQNDDKIGENTTDNSNDSDIDLNAVEDEELPDFLKGEDVQIIQ